MLCLHYSMYACYSIRDHLGVHYVENEVLNWFEQLNMAQYCRQFVEMVRKTTPTIYRYIYTMCMCVCVGF